ncbi:MAG: carboxypeptidase M32 [Clostridium sp.]
MKEKINELKVEVDKIGKMNAALEIAYWDMQTKMPKKAIEQRAGVVEFLSGELFKLTTSDKIGGILEYFKENTEELSDMDKGIVRLSKKRYEQTKKIPEEMYKEFILASAISQGAWEEAKEKKDFEIFKPHLEKMVEFQKRFADYYGYKDERYDALLDQYEDGLTVKELDGVFKELKSGILELLNKIKESGKIVDNSFLYGKFDKEKQEKFSKFILDKIGYDFELGRLDESMHPFTIAFGNKDVRITTNYENDDITNALFSCIHEGGHGIYEQNVPNELQYTGLDTGLSMSIHESQSRFYENIIGRSFEFWEYFYPYLQYQFKEFENVGLKEFYEGINKVYSSLIRTEADELTYGLHIIIRYEIEKALIEGSITVDEVRDEWNKKYKEYLGVEPKDDSEGILQDVHWSDGSFGYFPSYALGNLYGAQMLHVMEKEYNELYSDIRYGKLKLVKTWLNENVHKYGAIYSPKELIKMISGEELQTKYFIEYLNKKYSIIYKIK